MFMKRTIFLGVLTAMMTFGAMQASADARGGFMGFIAGCCFGPRAAGAYNEGKQIHWREWGRMIPYAGVIFAIWDGVDGAGGKTTADFAAEYGSQFY